MNKEERKIMSDYNFPLQNQLDAYDLMYEYIDNLNIPHELTEYSRRLTLDLLGEKIVLLECEIKNSEVKMKQLLPKVNLDEFLQQKNVLNYGSTFLYNASQEMIQMLERQRNMLIEMNHEWYNACEVIQIINPHKYTYALLETSEFDFSKYFYGVDNKGEKSEK